MRVVAAISLVLLLSGAAQPSQPTRWSWDLDLLATDREKALFVTLRDDATRQLFLERFWEARDPQPQTARNEMRDGWERRLAEATRRWPDPADDRTRALLLRGAPSSVFHAGCPRSGALEVWAYEPQRNAPRRTVFVFVAGQGAVGRLWRPGSSPDLAAAAASERCSELLKLRQEVAWIRMLGEDRYGALLEASLSAPSPREWVSTFRPISVDAPAGAPRLEAALDVAYAGRREGRVIVRVTVSVAPRSLPAAPVEGELEFTLAGQVSSGGAPLETFLYRLRGRPVGSVVPLLFERSLTPGEYTLRVRLEHLASGRVLMAERALSVPSMQTAARDPSDAAAPAPRLRLLQPAGGLLIGQIEVPVLVEQVPDAPAEERIEQVAFFLDGKPLWTRRREPYDLIVDLGSVPHPRRLRAEARTSTGKLVARDELVLNAAAQSFRVRLLEPRPGRAYQRSVAILAEVTPPPGAAVERVEVWFGEQRLATLYQPPYSQPFVLPRPGEAGYVRAVAYLADGGSSEDVVFVNTPQEPARVDVRIVELFATVSDRQGRPVGAGLEPAAFTVLEDGVRQSIREVTPATTTPLRVVTLIDCSESMLEEMAATRMAALGFLRRLRPADRAAIISFNRGPAVTVPLTGDVSELEKGIGKLLVEGDTALHDSLAYSLLYLSATNGQRAVLLLTDGEDTSSRLNFEQTLEAARRMGIAIYAIGLGVSGGRLGAAREQLVELARATGGRSFFVRRADALAGIYAEIEKELRSQYRIAYQSSHGEGGDTFRAVEVRLAKQGLRARTISGYFP